jgi:hypothetical protein
MKGFKSGRQRCVEIKAIRRERRLAARERRTLPTSLPAGSAVPVDYTRLMANNSYGPSDFVRRGFYLDIAFTCGDCGVACVWTAEQQRWWYETLGGSQYACAKRCRACRQRERQRKELARQAAQAGLLEKQATGR